MDKNELIEKLRTVAAIRCHTEFEDDVKPERQFSEQADVDWVNAEIRAGNEWAWFRAHVTASYAGFTGEDWLGACSYKSEADWKEPGGYYDDMVHTALSQLADKLVAVKEDLSRLGL